MSRHSKVKSRTTRLQYSQWVLSLTLCLGHFTNNQKKKKHPRSLKVNGYKILIGYVNSFNLVSALEHWAVYWGCLRDAWMKGALMIKTCRINRNHYYYSDLWFYKRFTDCGSLAFFFFSFGDLFYRLGEVWNTSGS